MGWTALVPLKRGAERKTRLAAHLSPAARIALSDRMASHVVAVLNATPAIDRVLLLAPEPVPELAAIWQPDEGRGLSPELDAAFALHDAPLLVIHGDLPLVETQDIIALLSAAESGGIAIAPDRHGAGTNAVAIFRPGPFAFAFGAESLTRHLAAAGPNAVEVCRPRLSLDVDTPADLVEAARLGFAS